MKKKKPYKTKSQDQNGDEPLSALRTNRLQIFKSFEEQEEYELQQMAALSSEQILQQLRKFINIAYGMHGYNPDNLPEKHFIKIISG